jgi:hypothetical protein
VKTGASQNIAHGKDRIVVDAAFSSAFAEGLNVVGLGFVRAVPAATGRPGKASEPSEQQPESKITPWLAAAASATARTALFTIGAAVGAALTKIYLGT